MTHIFLQDPRDPPIFRHEEKCQGKGPPPKCLKISYCHIAYCLWFAVFVGCFLLPENRALPYYGHLRLNKAELYPCISAMHLSLALINAEKLGCQSRHVCIDRRDTCIDANRPSWLDELLISHIACANINRLLANIGVSAVYAVNE